MRRRSPAASFPPGPGRTFPLYYLLTMRRSPIRFLTGLVDEYGDFCHFRSGRQHVYLVNRPELVKEVLVTQGRNFTKGRSLHRIRPVLGQGLLTSEGDLHDSQRQLIRPAFHHQRIADCGRIMVGCAARAAAGWRDGEAVDMTREMMRLTVRIVGKSLFDPDFERVARTTETALQDILERTDRITLPFGRTRELLPTASTLRLKGAQKRLDKEIYRLMDKRDETGGRSDLLSLLLAARDGGDPDRGISDVQVRDEIFTLIMAGNVTITNALAWTWYSLAQDSRVEEGLHAELDKVLDGRLPEVKDLPELKYTRMILAESLRLYPPVWITSRRAIQECEIGGYRIPAGSIVMMSQYLMHHDRRHYPDPSRFDPARWTAEAESARPRFAYFPFAAGLRGCLGEPFAWMEGTLVLATLAQRWRPRLDPEARIALDPAITLRPRYGMPMTLHQR